MIGRPDRIPYRRTVGRMAPDLVAELAGVAGAGDDDRDPVAGVDPSDEEPEPLQLVEARLAGRGPDDLLEGVRAGRALDGEVVQLVGARLDPDPHVVSLRDVAEPDAV